MSWLKARREAREARAAEQEAKDERWKKRAAQPFYWTGIPCDDGGIGHNFTYPTTEATEVMESLCRNLQSRSAELYAERFVVWGWRLYVYDKLDSPKRLLLDFGLWRPICRNCRHEHVDGDSYCKLRPLATKWHAVGGWRPRYETCAEANKGYCQRFSACSGKAEGLADIETLPEWQNAGMGP